LKTAIMQPYLFPYIGYFQLINAVDQFILYDDVAYIKNGWINRNRYLLNGEAKYFTLSIDRASSFKPINQTFILSTGSHRTKEKAVKNLAMAYAKAPYFKHIQGLIEEILLNPDDNIAVYNENAIRKVCAYLGIKTKILVSSELGKDTVLTAQDKVIDICKIMHTRIYINAIGGKSLYFHEDFNKNSMQLKFLRPHLEGISYKQFGSPFVPGLSIIDVMMFNSIQEARIFLNEYSLED
jgi:hypothetical protein